MAIGRVCSVAMQLVTSDLLPIDQYFPDTVCGGHSWRVLRAERRDAGAAWPRRRRHRPATGYGARPMAHNCVE